MSTIKRPSAFHSIFFTVNEAHGLIDLFTQAYGTHMLMWPQPALQLHSRFFQDTLFCVCEATRILLVLQDRADESEGHDLAKFYIYKSVRSSILM